MSSASTLSLSASLPCPVSPVICLCPMRENENLFYPSPGSFTIASARALHNHRDLNIDVCHVQNHVDSTSKLASTDEIGDDSPSSNTRLVPLSVFQSHLKSWTTFKSNVCEAGRVWRSTIKPSVRETRLV